jgi:dihydroorotate dehydrogenase
MGLTFPHRIGLAAGLDKNGEHIQGLSRLGFAFIEVGTVTLKAQAGNPKPRLFRLSEAQALINRMGFNNKGVDALIEALGKTKRPSIVGINIGKNKETSLQDAAEEYSLCLQKVYPHAAYITINISSPNTPDLRQLQQTAYLDSLLQRIVEERKRLSDYYGRHVPLLVKLSPDEAEDSLKRITASILNHSIEGMILTNTTCSREGVEGFTYAEEIGGLSGKPLFERSTECLRLVKAQTGNALTLIGAGGIHSGEQARLKLEAGADLLQIYTGLIYQGPSLIKELIAATLT